MDERSLRASNWSRYWASGALHSCADSFEGNYADEIEAFWLNALNGMAAGARLLDLATGNGPLPKLLLDALDDRAPDMDAIDLSQINPAWPSQYPLEKRQRIRFRGGVSAEELPYPHRHFDYIISQFGFEYADRAPALAEVIRVAKPDASIVFVLHHADSRPVNAAQHELADCEWVLSEGGLVATALQLGPYVERTLTPAGLAAVKADPVARQVRVRYNSLQQALQERVEKTPVPDLLHAVADALGRVLASVPASGWRQAESTIVGMCAALRDSADRLRDLIAHALKAEDAEAICSTLREHGFDCRTGLLRVSGHDLGWTLEARRRQVTGQP